MLTNRLPSRTVSNRGGFTLVELLVVIGIIAILAGVALGPITSQIKKAKESSAVQQSHAIGLAMFAFANDNNQLYPDTSNPSAGKTGAVAVAYALLNGGYVSDPAQLWISGGKATKYSGSGGAGATSITASNISFDFVGANGGTGLNSTVAQYMPLLWNSVSSGEAPSLTSASTANSAITATLLSNSASAFGNAGLATFYCNQSAVFNTALTGTVTMVPAASNAGTAPTGLGVLAGGD